MPHFRRIIPRVGYGLFLVGVPFFSGAVAPVPTSGTITDAGGIYETLCEAANWFFAFVMVLAIIAILYSALLFFTAGGDEKKVSRARQFIFYGIVGIIVAVLAKSIIYVVGDFLDVQVRFFGRCG